MRQKTRRILTLSTLLLFPVVMNYLSPYVPIDAAFNGVVAGSLLVFAGLFVSGILAGRAWCGWICPMASLGDVCLRANSKNVNSKKLKKVRYTVFVLWAGVLIGAFVIASGIKGFNFLYFTETGVSVDMPVKFIIVYAILAAFIAMNVFIGKRGACHAVCWMAPFLTAGAALGDRLNIPRLRVLAKSSQCTACGACNKGCPMSIAVGEQAAAGRISSRECILCGECVDTCRRNALYFKIK